MFLAGAYTGVVQTPVRQVVERVKSVMQVRELEGGKSPYKWSGSCFVELIRKEGWRNGLFQGMSSVFLREVPQFAIYYPAYEFFRNLYSEVCVYKVDTHTRTANECIKDHSFTLIYYYLIIIAQHLSNPMLAQFLAGGTAGTIQWLPPIYCFDVLKTRMQTAPQGYYKNLSDCARRLYAEHGLKVFFRSERRTYSLLCNALQCVQFVVTYICMFNNFV